MKNNLIIIAIVTLVVGLGAGFFGGMKYQQSKTPTRQFGNNMMNGQRAGGTGAGNTPNGGNSTGFRPVAGEITAADDKSITVKMNDGSSKIIILSEKTEINKASTGTKDELKTGVTVSVFGTDNSDGSVTAQTIQLNPVFRNIPTPTN